MKKSIFLFSLILFVSIPVYFHTLHLHSIEVKSEERPEEWAVPIQKPGLPNFFKVSDTLYRGAQPTKEGMRELKKMGIKTVINLRSFHSDRSLLETKGLDYVHIYMKAWHPENEDLIRFLKIVTDPSKQPVFVHCQHGADRTGTMCAMYRMVVMGWQRDDAIREMIEGGFGYHKVWDKFIMPYLQKIDISQIKKEAGLQ